MYASLLSEVRHLSVFPVFTSGIYWESTVTHFWCFVFALSLIGNPSILVSGDRKLFGLHLGWLGSSSNRRCSCCHHHNLPLSFCGIIMAMKQDSLWLPTALCRPFLYVFILALNWWDTESQNAEPECCDDLHWDLWGVGGHGNGLLRLLVS